MSIFLNNRRIYSIFSVFLFISIISLFCIYFFLGREGGDPYGIVKGILRKKLSESGEEARMQYVECIVRDVPENDPVPGVKFYLTCGVEKPREAAPVYVEAAIGARGYVKFFEITRLER